MSDVMAGGRSGDAPGVYVPLADLVRLRHEARGFSFLPRQPVGSLLAGRRGSRLRGRGLDFEEIRDYVPGDDVRTIDWKVTARTRKPHVRVFLEERDRPALLLVDQRVNMFFGTRVALKSVLAAEAAALAAWRVFMSGDRVGALVFDDRDVVEIKPHRSERRVLQVLRTVVDKNRALRADLEVASRPAALNEVLDRASRLAKHDHLVLLVSDFLGADRETRRLLTRLAAENDVVAALVYDPSSTAREVTRAIRLVVSDGSLQLELDTGDARRRRQLSDFMAERQRRVAETLRALGIPMLALSTDRGVTEQVREQLGSRPAAARRGG